VDNIWKVGANSPLPWGQIYPYGRGRSTPLTINTTNHVTKNLDASHYDKSKNDQPKQLAKEWGPGHETYDRMYGRKK